MTSWFHSRLMLPTTNSMAFQSWSRFKRSMPDEYHHTQHNQSTGETTMTTNYPKETARTRSRRARDDKELQEITAQLLAITETDPEKLAAIIKDIIAKARHSGDEDDK